MLDDDTICLIVKDDLIKCRAFALIRKRFFKANSFSDLFENVNMDDVLFFLREIMLYEEYDGSLSNTKHVIRTTP